MTTKVIMPQMGESVFEGTLTKWLKKVGDTVVRDEPLFEISTDKVDSEIPAPASGILSEILVEEGKTIEINTVLAVIDDADKKQEATQNASKIEETEPEPKSEEKPAQESNLQRELAEESQSEEQKPAEAAKDDKIVKTAVPAPDEVSETKEPSGEEKPSGIGVADIRTSPLVRKIARESNVDLTEVPASGLEGRITKEDILNYLDRRSTGDAARKPATRDSDGADAEREAVSAAPESPSKGPEPMKFVGESETVPLTAMRKAIAEHMVSSKRISAHVNTVFEVDMTAVVQLRDSHKGEFQNREGIPLTYTPFFAKALVDNVREFPVFNASMSGDNVIYKKPINLGIAVALETGLIVPVIRNAHLKSFTGLALAINDLAERARSKRLKPDDVKDGTISLTNPGSYGALFNTPIISQPQVAILGVGGIEKRPVVISDAIAVRSMVYLSLTFDHRLIDGAAADQFMATLKDRLQSWSKWLD